VRESARGRRLAGPVLDRPALWHVKARRGLIESQAAKGSCASL
jgi:hypothetical protein